MKRIYNRDTHPLPPCTSPNRCTHAVAHLPLHTCCRHVKKKKLVYVEENLILHDNYAFYVNTFLLV